MICIDEKKIDVEIEKRKPKAVLLNAPDGILPKLTELAGRIENKFGIPVFILAERSYGICDTAEFDAERLGADLAFHIGHTVSVDHIWKRTVLVDAFDDISFDHVLDKTLPLLNGYRAVGLSTSSQHSHKVGEVKNWLEDKGVKVVVGRGKGLLTDGHVFGCEFYPVTDIKDQVDAYLFLGQSRFHALGIALSTDKPTLMLDPYFNEIFNVKELAEERLKKVILSIYKASEADTFGLIVGLKEGQILVERTLKMKRELEALGKNVNLIALREVTDDRLVQFARINAFIQSACPRISVDGDTFSKPVLSMPQAEAMIRLLRGEDLGDFLQRRHWL